MTQLPLFDKKTMRHKLGHGRTAVYYRVSTERQDYESQKKAVADYFEALPEEKRPVSIVPFYDKITGSTSARRDYQTMLERLYQGDFDTLVVYRLDRLSRSATTAIRLILDLDELGVGFVAVSQPVLNLARDVPFRKTMLAAFAEIAEIERETIVSRVKLGLAAAKANGVILGRRTVVSRELGDKIHDLRGQGMSTREISKEVGISRATIARFLSPDHPETGWALVPVAPAESASAPQALPCEPDTAQTSSEGCETP